MQIDIYLVYKTGIRFNAQLPESNNVVEIHLVCDFGLQNKPIPVSHKLSWNLDFPCELEFRTCSL